MVVAGFAAHIRELLAGGKSAAHGGGKMIDRDLDLRAAHAFVRGNEAFGKKIAARVVNEQCQVAVAIELRYVLCKRVQRLRHVTGSGEHV